MLARLLDEELKKKNLSARAASREIGVAHTTIIRILEGQPSDVETLRKIADWMGVQPSTMLDGWGAKEGKSMLMLKALLEQDPRLMKIFEDAADDVLAGRLPAEDLQEILRYAAFRLEKRKP